jgi:RimJ/RimL family protein N-acetyltransferase
MFPDLTRDDVFRLETRRLWLRWPRLADAQALVRLAGEKAVAEMTAHIPHPYGPEDAERFVYEARRSNTEGRGLSLLITPCSKPNSPIGGVGIRPSERGAQLGYWIGTPYWGQGYATEAAHALVDAFFAYTEGRRLEATCRVINPVSRHVLERCGFSHLGSGLEPLPARGGVFPVDEFRLERRTWESLKTWARTGYVPLASEPERLDAVG